MRAKIILFVVGSGGNFLNLVLTLDPSTVPLGGYVNQTHLSANERAKIYHYDNVIRRIEYNDFNQMYKDGLTKWVYLELKELYFPLSIGVEKLVELDQMIVEMIHPHHWEEKRKLFGPDDLLELFYLDITNCEQWVAEQQVHKVRAPGTSLKIIENSIKQQNDQMLDIVRQQKCPSISLEKIIAGVDPFVDEYERASRLIGVNSYIDLAIEIYLSWQKTWNQKKEILCPRY